MSGFFEGLPLDQALIMLHNNLHKYYFIRSNEYQFGDYNWEPMTGMNTFWMINFKYVS